MLPSKTTPWQHKARHKARPLTNSQPCSIKSQSLPLLNDFTKLKAQKKHVLVLTCSAHHTIKLNPEDLLLWPRFSKAISFYSPFPASEICAKVQGIWFDTCLTIHFLSYQSCYHLKSNRDNILPWLDSSPKIHLAWYWQKLDQWQC